MTHDPEQLEQLTAYLDGELSPARRAEVDKLLSEDPDARALLLELQQTSRLVSALPREPTPDGLADTVVQRMERQDLLGDSPANRPRSSQVVSWSRRVAVAASIALVGTAVWIAWPHFAQVMNVEKLPVRLAQADKVQEASTPPPREERGPSDLGKANSPRPSAGPAPGDAVASRKVRTKAPLALGYVGDDGDDEEANATAVEAPAPAFARRFVAKLERTGATQPAARTSIAPRPAPSVTVEADVATIARLTDLVEKDMARHAVPMRQADAKEKLTQLNTPFYTLRRATASLSPPFSTDAPRPRAGEVPGNGVRIVIRVPQDVAEQVLANMRQITEQTDTAAGWTTGGRRSGPSRAAGRASGHTAYGKMSPAAEGDVQEDASPELDHTEKPYADAPVEQGVAGAKDTGMFESDAERSPAQKADRRRSISKLAASRPAAPPAEPLVTLTIHLKTKSPTASAAATQPSIQPAVTPTSQAAPPPTTQESPSG